MEGISPREADKAYADLKKSIGAVVRRNSDLLKVTGNRLLHSVVKLHLDRILIEAEDHMKRRAA